MASKTTNGLSQNWSNAVANKQDYIAVLKAAIWRLHNCGVVHADTVHVIETFQGKTVWEGDVKVFDLVQHPKAKRAYAWAHVDGPNDEQTRFVTVLEIPRVKDAETAVQASIMTDLKKGTIPTLNLRQKVKKLHFKLGHYPVNVPASLVPPHYPLRKFSWRQQNGAI